jgi:biotin synthase
MTRYHHNLETAARFFSHICTQHGYDEDICQCACGQGRGPGGLFGGIIALAKRLNSGWNWPALAELDVDSVPVNFPSCGPGDTAGTQAKTASGRGVAVRLPCFV